MQQRFFNGASKPKLGASNFAMSKCTFLHFVLYFLRRSLAIGFDYHKLSKSQQKSFDGDKKNRHELPKISFYNPLKVTIENMDIRGQFSGFVKKKRRRCEKKVYVTYEARKLQHVLPKPHFHARPSIRKCVAPYPGSV